MAFMNAPLSTASAADRVPVLAYDARSGRLSLHDRALGDDGKWATVKTDVTRSEPAFAVDFGRLETGWIYFADARAPLWAMAPHGQPPVPEPPAPAVTPDGKPLRFKAGFRVPVVGRAIGGVREFAGNSAAIIAGMNELHTEFEEAPEARAGKIPLVKLVDAREIRSGQSSNYQPIFEIQSWVDRPAMLGERTVPAPGAPATQAQPPRMATATRRDTRGIDDVHTERLASTRTPAPALNGHAVRQAGGGQPAVRARFAAQVA